MAARVNTQRLAPLGPPSVAPPPTTADEKELWPVLALARFTVREFCCRGTPVGKPRMTRRDKFLHRPCVMRYRAFADGLREAAGSLPGAPDILLVTAHVPMPPSWSGKKKGQMQGQPCRQTPDWDNIGKAVSDALFAQDSSIWLGLTAKYWCRAEEARVQVKILYAKSTPNQSQAPALPERGAPG
jgi:Holliday junction resolvase RusA-like endonuclease